MPELPEVETVRRDLEKYLKGKKVLQVEIKDDFKKRISPTKEKFIKFLQGAKFHRVERVGKMLIFDFSAGGGSAFGGDKSMKVLAHMKMTGQFVFVPPRGKIITGGHPIGQSRQTPDRFNKVLLDFGSAGKLYYNDMRKFGYLRLADEATVTKEKLRFGMEPIVPEFTLEVFNSILKRKPNLEIKKVLLMQELIAGIGNIYADESCFAAGVMPDRKVKSLKLAERKKLYIAIVKILKKAIEERGTSFNTYVDARGEKGNFVRFLKVYGRAGLKCLKCKKATIQKMKVAQRGTSYCSVCQK